MIDTYCFDGQAHNFLVLREKHFHLHDPNDVSVLPICITDRSSGYDLYCTKCLMKVELRESEEPPKYKPQEANPGWWPKYDKPKPDDRMGLCTSVEHRYREYRCSLPAKHEGSHVHADGLRWGA